MRHLHHSALLSLLLAARPALSQQQPASARHPRHAATQPASASPAAAPTATTQPTATAQPTATTQPTQPAAGSTATAQPATGSTASASPAAAPTATTQPAQPATVSDGAAPPAQSAPAASAPTAPASAPAAEPGDGWHRAPGLAPIAPSPVRPWLNHRPPTDAVIGRPVVLAMDFLNPQELEHAVVHYRVAGTTEYHAVSAYRGSSDGYLAEIPAQPTSVRTIEYYISLDARDGYTHDAFGLPEAPHTLVLRATSDTDQEQRELAYHHGQRLELMAGGEYTDFGTHADPEGNLCIPRGQSAATPGQTCADYYSSFYGSARYHFFQLVRSIAIRVDRIAGQTTRPHGGLNPAGFADVGLVSATQTLEFRVHPSISLSLINVIGASENAVTAGGGGSVEFGVGSPTQVLLSFVGVADFGVTGTGWLRWQTIPNIPMGAGVEITTQPGGNHDPALRLLYDVSFPIGRHVQVTARGGFASRRLDALGFTAGGQLTVSF